MQGRSGVGEVEPPDRLRGVSVKELPLPLRPVPSTDRESIRVLLLGVSDAGGKGRPEGGLAFLRHRPEVLGVHPCSLRILPCEGPAHRVFVVLADQRHRGPIQARGDEGAGGRRGRARHVPGRALVQSELPDLLSQVTQGGVRQHQAVTLDQILFAFAGRLGGQFAADHLGQERRG
jgi:hypothetical protein